MRKTFRQLLEQDGPIMGTFLQIPSPEIIEVMAAAGYQYVILDQEHAQMTDEQVLNLVRTADSVGIATQIRIPQIREDLVKHALDMGAGSLKVPDVRSAEEARTLVRYAKFPPLGDRGACPYVRANRWGTEDLSDYYARANDETVLAVIVERPEALEQIEDIIATDGIDIIGVGRVDMSVALGIPGQTGHPKVYEALQRLSDLCVKHGKVCGTAFLDPAKEAPKFRHMKGMKYFNGPSVQRVLYPAFKAWADETRANLTD